MTNEDEKLAIFELEMLKTYGLKPYELEQIDLFTIQIWLQQELKQKVKSVKQQIFNSIKNGRTNN